MPHEASQVPCPKSPSGEWPNERADANDIAASNAAGECDLRRNLSPNPCSNGANGLNRKGLRCRRYRLQGIGMPSKRNSPE